MRFCRYFCIAISPDVMSDNFGWINSSFEAANNVFEEKSAKKSPKTVKRKRQTAVTSRKKIVPFTKNKDPGLSWNESCLPKKKDELAVHPKKVSEVEEWLKSSLSNCQGSSILLLTGPAGSGKTATIRVLSKEMLFEINEWSSSVFEGSSSFLYKDGVRQSYGTLADVFSQSQTSIFRNFLLRANKYSSLFADHHKRIILVEEFPNVFLRDSSIFHEILRHYDKIARCPIVFIISESTIGNSLETQLFPKHLQTELKIHQINFNPVAQTMLLKALKRISCFGENCNKIDLDSIAADSQGDIRNAVNTLQFMNSSSTKVVSSKAKSRTIKKSSKKSKDSTDNESSSEFNKRNSSLFLFHALGKILYCKRDGTKKCDNEKLPDHLKHLERVPLVENPEEVFTRTSISSDSFSLFLHENYLMFTKDMESAANSAAAFSEADVISIEWTGRDILNEYSASLASRGLMYNLSVEGSRSRWETLHKPQYFSVVKENRSMSLALKNAFKETRLSLKELETELIPYLSKLRISSQNREQIAIVDKIGQMSVRALNSRGYSESLYSREAVLDTDEFSEKCSQPVLLQSVVTENDLLIDPDEDEDLVIEDPDS